MDSDKQEIPLVECDTASQFLNELDETNERWQGNIWIYRGLTDSTLSLIPRVMRDSTRFAYGLDEDDELDPAALSEDEVNDKVFGSEGFHPRLISLYKHLTMERLLVDSFTKLAEFVGLNVPIDPVSQQENSGDPELNTKDRLKQHNAHGLPTSIRYALAQHHGVPTRLLDWTFRPQIAAYFAAQSNPLNCRKEKGETDASHIAVWAIRRGFVWMTSARIARHSFGQIEYLRAQEGLFLYDVQANSKFLQFGKWLPLDDELAKLAGLDSVYKLTLPYSQREDLLKLLRLKKASLAFLMPSFDNVAKDYISDPWAWHKFLDM